MKTCYKCTKKILLVSIVALFILALIVLGITTFEQNSAWFSTLTIPNIQPPSWMFVIIWTIIYIMVAISVVMVLGAPKNYTRKKTVTIVLFIMSGILNALYCITFFGMRSILLAFIELPLLIASILLLIWCIQRFNKTAAYLLIPYLLWVIFTTVLTGMTLFLNS